MIILSGNLEFGLILLSKNLKFGFAIFLHVHFWRGLCAFHSHWCPLFICTPFLTVLCCLVLHLVLVWTSQSIYFLLFCPALMSHTCKDLQVTAYFLNMGTFFFLSAILCIMACQNICTWSHVKGISLLSYTHTHTNSHRSLDFVIFCFVFVCCFCQIFSKFSCLPCAAFWNTFVTALLIFSVWM